LRLEAQRIADAYQHLAFRLAISRAESLTIRAYASDKFCGLLPQMILWYRLPIVRRHCHSLVLHPFDFVYGVSIKVMGIYV
jgi:hypothetical protein